MLLCIDIGNSHIYGGLFNREVIQFRFRYTSKAATSDEIGIFLKSVIRENNIESQITRIGACSVVPQLDYSIRAACVKYFGLEPFFLQAGVKTGLKIKYRNQLEVGADRIANAIAAVQVYPNQNIIVIDFGTATTFCAISANKEYLGGVILPGVRLSVDALSQNTAKLPAVEIMKREEIIGRSTIESIQSGIFYGALGACKEITQKIKQESFAKEPVKIIATGGLAHLFDEQGIYDEYRTDLVLDGIRLACIMNGI